MATNGKIGARVMDNGTIYTCVAVKPHTCLDGRETFLEVWQGACVVCSKPFTFTRPMGTSAWQVNRRCPKHKRPGVKARKPRAARPAATTE
jgi:hypothetical protein